MRQRASRAAGAPGLRVLPVPGCPRAAAPTAVLTFLVLSLASTTTAVSLDTCRAPAPRRALERHRALAAAPGVLLAAPRLSSAERSPLQPRTSCIAAGSRSAGEECRNCGAEAAALTAAATRQCATGAVTNALLLLEKGACGATGARRRVMRLLLLPGRSRPAGRGEGCALGCARTAGDRMAMRLLGAKMAAMSACEDHKSSRDLVERETACGRSCYVGGRAFDLISRGCLELHGLGFYAAAHLPAAIKRQRQAAHRRRQASKAGSAGGAGAARAGSSVRWRRQGC
jgi:hypothetical protein